MESDDDSYETTSELLRDFEVDISSTSSRSGRCVSDLGPYGLYTPDPTANGTGCSSIECIKLGVKVRDQKDQLQLLKSDRVGLLEEMTRLYGKLEEKENELVEFIDCYEQKVNDVANYMQEVQNLLVELGALFPVKLNHQNGHTPQTDISVPESDSGGDSSKLDTRGRTLLQALSASVACASARNKQDTLPRHTPTDNPITTIPKEKIPNGIPNLILSNHITSTGGYQLTPEGKVSDAILGVLPSFCWTNEQVVYWLNEYAHLPGGCLDAAKRTKIDGQQLMILSDLKAQKMLHLNDAGLRRKFKLAVEDLRVYGVPGLSRTPGPSHLHPSWVCAVWLHRYVGLVQLAALFATRRVNGRLLASLAVYQPQSGTRNSSGLSKSMSRHSTSMKESKISQTDDTSLSLPLKFRGANGKELHRILLGIGRDGSTADGASQRASGAELPLSAAYLLGKRETRSLTTGIELLRAYNFNIQALESAQQERENDLMLWTNERLSSWLDSIGLHNFTHGISGTGLHGAYMVLDPTFNVEKLMKILRIPSATAASCQLEEQFESILQSARQRQGIVRKYSSFFRRRSISRSQRPQTIPLSIIATSTHIQHTNSSSCISISDSSSQNGSVDLVANSARSAVRNGRKFDMDLSHTPKIWSSPFPTSRSMRNRVALDRPDGVSKDQLSCNLKQSDSQSILIESSSTDDRSNGTETTNDDQSSTLVRQKRWNASQKFKGLNLLNSKSRSESQENTKKTAILRTGLKPSEAPLIDPFSEPGKGPSRVRIVLGQKPRVTRPNTTASLTTTPVLSTPKFHSDSFNRTNSIQQFPNVDMHPSVEQSNHYFPDSPSSIFISQPILSHTPSTNQNTSYLTNQK